MRGVAGAAPLGWGSGRGTFAGSLLRARSPTLPQPLHSASTAPRTIGEWLMRAAI